MNRTMSPSKKYAVWNPAKDKTIVELLLDDDERHFLTPSQRTAYLERVEKKYKAAKKKAQDPSVALEEKATELIKKFEQQNKEFKTLAKVKV